MINDCLYLKKIREIMSRKKNKKQIYMVYIVK